MINGLWLGTIIYAIIIVTGLIAAGIVACIAVRKEIKDE